MAVSAGGDFVNQAGFLSTFLLRPALDTDGDGLADELDPDNDDDRLSDSTEISGSSFQPATPTGVNLADSDGDGVLDGLEAAAGTDPGDADARLAWVAISNSVSGLRVAWQARGNNQRTYVVRAAPDAGKPYATVLFSNTVSGGVGPWFALTTSVTHATASNVHAYAVEVLP